MNQPVKRPAGHPVRGVEILGAGSAVPDNILTNDDLTQMFDTSDEWIVKRTGIRERRVVLPSEKAPVIRLSTEALNSALADAGLKGSDLDLVMIGTVTGEMRCPSASCRVAHAVGAGHAGALDVGAACSGFVYSLNIAETLIASGRYERVGVIGCDVISRIADYTQRGRGTSILFGDAAGAVVLGPSENPDKGCLAQTLHADGGGWDLLYIPEKDEHVPENVSEDVKDTPFGLLRMKGREVFKFAVSTFSEVMQETVDKAGLTMDDVAMVIPHQSNLRIIESARKHFHIPDEKIFVNIDKYGNSSAGSVGLCFDQLWKSGRIKRGDKVLMVAFGGGLTWASSLWQL